MVAKGVGLTGCFSLGKFVTSAVFVNSVLVALKAI